MTGKQEDKIVELLQQILFAHESLRQEDLKDEYSYLFR